MSGNSDDQWQDRWMAEGIHLGRALAVMHQDNTWPDIPLLPEAMKYLMSKL